ncbi:MAG: BMP family ABC transporter substrate-binding protein [Aestuariivita sp.]|nr:BMP family ABC transporter substrate-binding protein [Aestuariivita sp.]MCY4345611.1 BMP family ABC transporter substrate-binding protein [Aestuariivita sp.]
MIRSIFAAAALSLMLGAGSALAEPALIYAVGSKFDKSFNESAYNGAQRWAQETGMSYREIELQSEAQQEQALRRFAEAGNNPIITMGFAMADPLAVVVQDYPDTTFVAIDVTWLDAPNIRQIGFAEHEGSYLVGILAAMASQSGTVGFVGGMDIPLVRHFACGYAQGVKSVNPEANVIINMTGTTASAWNDPVKGSELTKAQISRGVDVVYAAAGATGVGVLQTSADEGILSIGVDSNQNYVHPGSVLTSMLKRVDVAVYDALKAGADIETGVFMFGLTEDGVGYALDEYNAALITDEMKQAADAAREQIINGEIKVVSYYDNDSCPVLNF